MNTRGFTLIELLIFLAVLGIIAAVVYSALSGNMVGHQCRTTHDIRDFV
jgi:prepilin-type N-terminal cleavage/methylation domain-containing protein